MTGHWEVLRESEVVLIDLQGKLAKAAVFISTNPDKDDRRFFIPSVYIGISNIDGVFPESALIGAFPRLEMSKGEYGIYLKHFVREQFAKFFAHIIACAGIKTLFFKNGVLTPNAVMIFKDNGIKVTKVDV
ncbi:MAG: hypothetical protein AAB555_02235 [Patescibacteria group bacterium]